MKAPKKYPCGSCPYRRDVPAGVWAASEYVRLIDFDKPTQEQPMAVFGCHQNDGHLCSGWVGCHDMADNLGLRLSAGCGHTTPEAYAEALAYVSPVPLFESGAEAARHGLSGIDEPNEKARRVISKLKTKDHIIDGH